MYEVFNYMTAETIGYVETEADAWYVVRNDSRPLDFLPWLESETPTHRYCECCDSYCCDHVQ